MPKPFLVPPTAPPNPGQIPDAPQRTLALDITQSFIVEAPAGSGKTGLLIQRFLKLLASETVTTPNQILAITFTRKATAEMRDRVFAQLAAAHAATPPANPFDEQTRPLALAALARNHALDWGLLDHPYRLNIRTIDSVCADIARGLPILSGSGGGLAPIDDAAPLHAEAAHRTLMLLGGDDHALTAALRLVLLHRDGNLADVQSLIASMLAARDQWGEAVPLSRRELDDAFLDATVLPRLEKALDHAICTGLTRLGKILPRHILDRLCTLAAHMAAAEGYKGAQSPIAICHGRRTPSEKAHDLEHWQALVHLLVKPSSPRTLRKSLTDRNLKFIIEKPHQTELKLIIAELDNIPGMAEDLCLIDALPPAQYPREQWLVTKALFRVLSRALVELQLVFAARAECDFAEVSLLAKSALRRDSALEDLSASSGIDLQHLLVDEMQDTSSSQYELIQLLTQRWDGHSQTVLLVGDPKQSVYLFRQARVERFVHTMHLAALGDLPLTVLQLTANFRSRPALVAHFNHDFQLLFPPTPDPLQPALVPYTPASAVRSPAPATPARVWHTAPLPSLPTPAECRTSRRTQSKADALEIRTLAATLHATPTASGAPLPTIAVLVRNRTHLIDIVAAFRQSPALPFRAVEIEPLAERQEILDLLALTRALLHPADRTAWLALLRTPWCGLTLADLHVLTGQDDRTHARHTIIEAIHGRGDLLSEDGIARLQPFWQVLSAAQAQRGKLPIAQLVERTWQAFAAPPFCTPEALSNTARFFALLAELEDTTGTLSIPRLTARLAKLYATPSLHPGAVDLMTIHGAKGLDRDLVLVPSLERTGQTSTSKLLSWLELDAGEDPTVAHGLLAPIKARGAASQKLNTWMLSIEKTREAAERIRLFYVACTRARETLHLFAAPQARANGTFAPKTDSLLHAAWPAAEPLFTDAQTTQAAGPQALPAQSPVPHSSQSHRDEWATSTSNLAHFPQPQLHPAVLDLAAAATPTPPTILRIPTHLIHATTTTAPTPQAPPTPAFTRPQGSFAARAVGNTTHALLELLAKEIALGHPPTALLNDLPTWLPRITALLRAAGLPPTLVQRLAAQVLRALTNTLTDPQGLWLLAPHPEAASESALTTWSTADPTRPSTIRLDRTFLAGPTPGSSGSTHLWIVDYKTVTHGLPSLPDFLAAEHTKHAPQLESYAHQLASLTTPPRPIRLALFYPMLPALDWWTL